MLQKFFHQWIASSLILLLTAGTVQAADPSNDPKIQLAIESGLKYLRNYDFKYRAATGLVVYTLYAGGESSECPAIQQGLTIILEKFQTSESGIRYTPTQHHFYEAAIDAMALEAADPEEYLGQIQAVANYIIVNQKDHGGWYYAGQKDTGGDTSITQYAILGLWAADRAGVMIPLEVYEKAADWHFQTQKKGGAYAYHPTNTNHPENQPNGSMSTAGSGSTGILRNILFKNRPARKSQKKIGNGPRFGVLEKSNPTPKRPNSRSIPKPIKPQLDAALEKSYRWLSENFSKNLTADHKGFRYYYFYTLERTASVNNWEVFGDHDWYQEGADLLLPKQAEDGTWSESAQWSSMHLHPSSTCFTLLFLMKATKKLLPTGGQPAESLGEGVLAGGRGLPDDLKQVDFRNGKLEFTQQEMGSYDQLLAGLSTINLSDESDLVKAPEKKVDLSDPKKLIGNKTLLTSLIKYSDPRVRQVAAWAVGQTDQLDLAGVLIPLLKDDDLAVAIEARLSLCWISRRPNGFNHPSDPLEEYKDSDVIVDENKKAAKWQKEVHKAWRKWYLDTRPYGTRDDFDDPDQTRFQKK